MMRIKRFYKHKGFTLLELLIVVIIVGILASLALPRFLRAAEKARWAEARAMLGSLRGSQIRYHIENDAYASSTGSLDVDIPDGRFFTFAAGSTSTSIGTATRKTETSSTAAGTAGDQVSISDDGDFSYTGAPAWVQ